MDLMLFAIHTNLGRCAAAGTAEQSCSLCSSHLFLVRLASPVPRDVNLAMVHGAEQADLCSPAFSAIYPACREDGFEESCCLL